MNSIELRNQEIDKIQDIHHDLIIIGGGITGAGIALDAASRGLKTLLLEKGDFASGTSSKSTKLIHGGLRYLKQLEFLLVREVGMERAIIHTLAPHLVKPEKMLLPLIKGGTYGKLLSSIGLKVYDFLARVRQEDQRKMLRKKDVEAIEPLLDKASLIGGVLYSEYRTDDARLTIEVLKTARKFNADVINYAQVTDFIYSQQGELQGLTWVDKLTKKNYTKKSTYIVNAAGPWVDNVRKIEGALNGKQLTPTMGIHIVVARDKFPISQALYFDEPGGRMLFAIPRGSKTYIGTTDTRYNGSLDDIHIRSEDVSYLLRSANNLFPSVQLSINDVESTWAGLRPLIADVGKSTSDISRKDEIFISESGLISIAGGKLTGYRKMAERVVNFLAKKSTRDGNSLKKCSTNTLTIIGGEFASDQHLSSFIDQVSFKLESWNLTHRADYLVHNYGTQTDQIINRLEIPNKSIPEFNLIIAELHFCIQNEWVYHLVDFFERRTGRLYFDIHHVKEYYKLALEYMTEQLCWSKQRKEAESLHMQERITACTHFE